ncbi:MAG TPA: hypothetical protein VGL35_12535 [Rhizomicrobium sp.]|jgi:hypothetical protein
MAFALAERQVLVDGPQVEAVHDRENFLHHPADLAIVFAVELAQKIHQLADEAEGARHVIARIAQSDFVVRPRIQPRQKKTVRQHLREGVGELRQLQFAEHLIAERRVKPEQPAFRVFAFLADKFFGQIIPQQLASLRQCEGQLLRTPDALRRAGKEARNQFGDGLNPLLAKPEAPVVEVGFVA